MRFGLAPYNHPYTLEEVGEEYNCGSERIRQIESKALRKLRHPTREFQLHDVVDKDIAEKHIKLVRQKEVASSDDQT
jgi:RNA polymerase primary sigma factor